MTDAHTVSAGFAWFAAVVAAIVVVVLLAIFVPSIAAGLRWRRVRRSEREVQ